MVYYVYFNELNLYKLGVTIQSKYQAGVNEIYKHNILSKTIPNRTTSLFYRNNFDNQFMAQHKMFNTNKLKEKVTRATKYQHYNRPFSECRDHRKL